MGIGVTISSINSAIPFYSVTFMRYGTLYKTVSTFTVIILAYIQGGKLTVFFQQQAVENRRF